MTKIEAYCKSCREDIDIKEMTIGTGCVRITLKCGHERQLFMDPRRT